MVLPGTAAGAAPEEDRAAAVWLGKSSWLWLGWASGSIPSASTRTLFVAAGASFLGAIVLAPARALLVAKFLLTSLPHLLRGAAAVLRVLRPAG